MANEIRRNYPFPDAVMIETSKTIRGCFAEDKADFLTYDPHFGDPFTESLNQQIEAAENASQDNSLIDQQVQLTAAVTAAMEACKDQYQYIKRIIERAFPGNKPVWNEFGYNDFEKVRASQPRMIQFMKNLHTTAAKYSAELTAAGFPQAKIDEILTLRDGLDTANNNQENFKKGRPVMTQERIDSYNLLWKHIVDLARAGKDIYKNNYAKYQRYVIVSGSGGEEEIIPPPEPVTP